jgi:hyperosmotically inducible protein
MKSRLLFGIGAAMLALACGQSDPGITVSVKSQLAVDDLVRARRIDVDTRDGVVTLNGEVRSLEEEATAIEIARGTEGVADVVNRLSVVPAPEPTTGIGELPIEIPPGVAVDNDAGITTAVKTKLLTDATARGLRIDVDTRDSVVTLTGTVRTQAEKAQALETARQVEGVASVTDRLTVEGRQ